MSALMPVSFSRLSTFESCPQKFDYLYVTKSVKDTDSSYTLYGSRVHEALEAYGRALAERAPPSEIEALEEKYTDDIARHFPLIKRIVRQPGKHLFEHQMSIRRDKTPCGWFDGDVWIRGIADVLVINGDKAWCGDHKTGKKKDNPVQLQLFAALVFACFPEVQEVKTSFIWLASGELTNAVYTRDRAPVLWESLEPRFNKVQDAVDVGVFKAKPSGLCRFCPAQDICESARK